MPTAAEKAYSMVQKAARSAVSNVAKLAGRSEDRDVIFYDSLTPQDFETIAQNPDWDVLSYIQEMESRKAGKGKKRS